MTTTTKPTPAAMRAAREVYDKALRLEDDAEHYDFDRAAIAIDRETGLPELVEALEMITCQSCQNRIGWDGEYDTWQAKQGRGDWRNCHVCQKARAALAKAKE